MNTSLLSVLALVAAPLAELGLVLQLGGLGTAVGSLVALRATRRSGRGDTWQITTTCTGRGLLLGTVLALAAALVQ